MDGLKQVEVVTHNGSGVSEILGLRGDGALYRGQVTIDPATGKANIRWTRMAEEEAK